MSTLEGITVPVTRVLCAMILEAEGVKMPLAFILYNLLFHKSIDIEVIVRDL